MNMPPTSHLRGFTLIELLVVITIIVVLLAMLVPAMDKAIYQATLMQCGANLKGVATSVQVYAMGHKRHYPQRDLPKRGRGDQTDPYITPRALSRPLNNWDMRPHLKGLLSINKQLICPFTDSVDMEDHLEDPTDDDVAVDCSYTTWWDWQYDANTVGPQKRMARVGDRWSWTDGGVTESYNVLVGDYDLYFPGEGVHGSHPDADGVLFSQSGEDVLTFGTRATFMLWWSSGPNPPRGFIDMNHAFDDGSVRRYDRVERYVNLSNLDERMGAVPLQTFAQQINKRFQVPLR